MGPGSHLDMAALLPGGSRLGEEPPQVAPVSFKSSLPLEKVLTLTSAEEVLLRASLQRADLKPGAERAPGLRAEQLGQEAKGEEYRNLDCLP